MANRSLVHSYVDRSLSFRERVPDANDENKLNLFTASSAIVHNSVITNLIQADKSSGRNESGLSLQLFIIANHFPLCKNCIRLFPMSNFYPIHIEIIFQKWTAVGTNQEDKLKPQKKNTAVGF